MRMAFYKYISKRSKTIVTKKKILQTCKGLSKLLMTFGTHASRNSKTDQPTNT